MHNLVDLRKFADIATTADEEDNVVWLQAWRYGKWDHPVYGEYNVDREFAERLKANFDNRTYGQDISVSFEHGDDPAKGKQAAAWIHDIEVRDDSVWYKTQFTEDAMAEVKAGKWRYFSPEEDDWTDKETGAQHQTVPMGGALTNRPFFKNMAPLNFSEYYTEVPTSDDDPLYQFSVWSTATMNDLPDSSFLYVEQGGSKDSSGKTTPRSKRHFPYKDASGKIDLPHLRNAIAQAPKATSVPGAVRAAVQAKARNILSSSGGKNNSEEDGVNELLRKFAEALGITLAEDDTEEVVLQKATELNDVIEPLRKAKEDGEARKTFRESFPQEYEEMQQLKASRIENDARKFAERFERFSHTVEVKDEEGNIKETKVESSTKGFSAKIVHAIEDVHKKFSEGDVKPEDLQELLDQMASDDAVVDYKETGSGRIQETKEFTSDKPRHQFAEVVKEIMEKDSLEYAAAVKVAFEREPELASAYQNDRKEA